MKAFDFKKHPAIFFSGTDTDVGKTTIMASLAAFLHEKGISCAVMKPVESGHRRGSPQSDSVYLQKISQTPQSLEEINCYTFKAPLAPSVASELESDPVEFKKINAQFQALQKQFEVVLMEGAGGLLSPLNSQQLVIDLIAELKIPVLLVATNRLGTVNHSLLSIEALKKRKIPILGLILNQNRPNSDNSPPWNRKMIEDFSHIKCWGNFPWIEKRDDPQILAQHWGRYIHY